MLHHPLFYYEIKATTISILQTRHFFKMPGPMQTHADLASIFDTFRSFLPLYVAIAVIGLAPFCSSRVFPAPSPDIRMNARLPLPGPS